jgi:hypothetical protein
LVAHSHNRISDLLLYPRESQPFGSPWEEWAALWCKWLLELPKDINPSIDTIGKNCYQNQKDPNVWFLGGTFGNLIPIRRYCRIPEHKAILFPILEKEDSFAEDTDLKLESELRLRAKEFIDRVRDLRLVIDGAIVEGLYNYRVQSPIFNLNFPIDCVYDVKPGLTKAVCDGYWIFLRPLPIGQHEIRFSGEVAMMRGDTVTDQFKSDPLYAHIKEHIHSKASFVLDITYQIDIG